MARPKERPARYLRFESSPWRVVAKYRAARASPVPGLDRSRVRAQGQLLVQLDARAFEAEVLLDQGRESVLVFGPASLEPSPLIAELESKFPDLGDEFVDVASVVLRVMSTAQSMLRAGAPGHPIIARMPCA